MNQLIQKVKELLNNRTQGTWQIEGKEVWYRGGSYEGTDRHVWIADVPNAENRLLITKSPELLQRVVDALEEANRTIADKDRENAEMKKLLMDVSEHLSWRNVDGSGPAKALGMIYTWAALSLMEDKTDD